MLRHIVQTSSNIAHWVSCNEQEIRLDRRTQETGTEVRERQTRTKNLGWRICDQGIAKEIERAGVIAP